MRLYEGVWLLLVEETVDKLIGVEDLQVGHLLTQPDVTDRDLELVADADDDAALGSAVELGEGEGIDIGGGSELAGLQRSGRCRHRGQGVPRAVHRA